MRALLGDRCNKVLGQFDDDVALFFAPLSAYLPQPSVLRLRCCSSTAERPQPQLRPTALAV
jgi:hypothetical protein